MSFVDALPSFKLEQWQVVVLLFLDALSVHRLPSLASQVTNMDLLLHKVKEHCTTTVPLFFVLFLFIASQALADSKLL